MTDPLFIFDPLCDDTPINTDELHTGWRLTLPAHVRRHAVQSMRLSQGDRLQLSDGHGLRIHAIVEDPNTGLVEIAAVGKETDSNIKLTLVQALAKKAHDEQAVDMATQIGVNAVIPWQADRSIVKWKADKMQRKWENVIEAACEQSRRVWKPELHTCMTSKQLTKYCREQKEKKSLVLLLHQDATAPWKETRELVRSFANTTEEQCISVIVGPEGGVSEQEVKEFTDAGAIATTIGSNILRASSAGAVSLSILSDLLGRFDV